MCFANLDTSRKPFKWIDVRNSTGDVGRSSTPGPQRPVATSPQTPRSSSTDISSGRSAAHIIRSADIYSWKIRKSREENEPVILLVNVHELHNHHFIHIFHLEI